MACGDNSGRPLAGAIVLRGCRCILVRAKAGAPMKLPALPLMEATVAGAALEAVVDAVDNIEDCSPAEAAGAAETAAYVAAAAAAKASDDTPSSTAAAPPTFVPVLQDTACGETGTSNVALTADGMEPYEYAGLRAASTLCAIDGPGELVPMTHIPPVLLHGKAPVLLHFYYASMPPPPGPLEDADMEDEDDYYGEPHIPSHPQAIVGWPSAETKL